MGQKNRAGRLILRGGTASGLGFLVRFGARFLFLLVAGRLYGATLFGAYSLAVALAEAAAIAGGLSTKWMLFKWLNERGGDGRPPFHIVLDAALLVLSASFVVTLVVIGAAIAIPQRLMAGNVEHAIVTLALTIPLQALIELLLGATRWTETMRYELVAKNLMQPYATIAVAIAAFVAGWREEGLVLSYVVGTLVSLVYTVRGAARCFRPIALRRYQPGPLRAMAKAVVPTTGAELIDALYTRLDIYVVGILLGAHSAGIYGMARQVSLPIRQVRQAFDGMLVPIVARTVSHAGPAGAGRPLASAARLILLVQVAGVIVLVAIARPLLHLIGRDFAYGMGSVLCLAVAELIQGAFGVSELLLIYSRPRAAVAMTAAFMILGAVAAILLEPHFGLTGIALALLLSYSGRAMTRRSIIHRIYDVRVPAAYWTGPAFAGAGGLAAALALSVPHDAGHSLLVAAPSLVAGLVCYGLCLFLWLRLTGESLVPRGFVAGAPAEAAR